MNEVVAFASQYQSVGIWGAIVFAFAAWVKSRPEVAKLANDRDASIRTDLMGEIRQLRLDVRQEREDCDRRIKQMEEAADERIEALEEQVRGLTRTITQNSSSSAQLIGEPLKTAETLAARKRRGEGPPS